MTQTDPEWAYLFNDEGRHWHNLEKRSTADSQGEMSNSVPARAVYAISSNDLISVPQWINSKEGTIIDQVVKVESEKLGIIRPPGPGQILDWRPVEISGSRTLVQSITIPWDFPDALNSSTKFIGFLPQYALFQPPENAVTLWKEKGFWIAGYSRGIRWAHVQPLGIESISTLASEVALTLVELNAKDILEDTNKLIFWHPVPETDLLLLEEKTGLPAIVTLRPAPSLASSGSWKLEPHSVSAKKLAKKKRRNRFLIGSLLVYLTILMVALAWVHLKNLKEDNARLTAKIGETRPTADKIEAAMESWTALGPAVEPERTPVEVFHRVSSLLPEKGFRLSNFQFLDHKTIVIRGEASAMSNALQFKGKLEKATELSDYDWEIPPPKTNNNLTEFYATGTYRY